MALLPGVVSQNWRLKLAALGLSVLLWALVQTDEGNAETFSSVPVRVEVDDTAWTLAAAPLPSAVELRMSGPTREMFRLAREGTVIRVPVSAVGSADTVVTLRRDWVALGDGSGVSVESVSPSAVRLTFEPARTRAVPVSVRLRGRLPDYLALASPMGVTPPVMRVRGPASRVEALDSVRLEVLDLADVRASGVIEVPVDTTTTPGVRVTPPSASLSFRLEDEVERLLAGVPVVVEGPLGDGSLVVEPQSVDVLLVGARTLVTAVDPSELTAAVGGVLVQGMVPGEERRVPLRITGVPELVTGVSTVELITVRRAADQDDSGGPP
ncbi:MAG: hypothetical protein RJQ04_21890 [Longimicrobiales bacterium]